MASETVYRLVAETYAHPYEIFHKPHVREEGRNSPKITRRRKVHSRRLFSPPYIFDHAVILTSDELAKYAQIGRDVKSADR